MKNLISPDKMFVGLKNYIDIFNDKVFVTSLRNTLVFTIGGLIIQFLIGFMLALFFNQNFKIGKTRKRAFDDALDDSDYGNCPDVKFNFWSDVGILNYILRSLGLIKEIIEC